MLLENIINRTLDFYREQNCGLFHKKGLEIKFSSLNKDKLRTLNGAYISEKSTVDYYGIYRGHFCAFEAKSVETGNILHKSNILAHQIKYLELIDSHNGIAFFIIGFIGYGRFFILDFKTWMMIKNLPLNIKNLSQEAIEIQLTFPGIINFIGFIRKKILL